jgi:hypothetical protein
VGSCRAGIALILFLLVVVAVAAAPAAAKTSTAKLRSELRGARRELHDARARLTSARADLAAAQATLAAQAAGDAAGDAVTTAPVPSSGDVQPATGSDASGETPTDPTWTEAVPGVIAVTSADVESLEGRVARLRRVVRRWRHKVQVLAARVRRREQIAEWNRRGNWRPLIGIAARRYRISAGGLYRLMQYESGGNRYAGSTYKGLFQYHPGTWRGGWNPLRGESIYNGWAQIRATALAIRSGRGRSMWPNTYPRAF